MPAKIFLTEDQKQTLIAMRAEGKSWEDIGKALGVSTWCSIMMGKELGVWKRKADGPIGGASAVVQAITRVQDEKPKPKRSDYDRAWPLPANHPYALMILNEAPSLDARWGSD